MRRIHLKKTYRYNKRKKNIIIVVILLCIMSAIILINKLARQSTPILINYAEKKARTISTIIINEAVNNNVFNDNIKNKIFIENKDNNGNISTDINSIVINTILNKITVNVENYLTLLENGQVEKLKISKNALKNYNKKDLKKGIIYEIPSGIIFKNSLLSNLGPKIPVKINLNGDVTTNVITKVESYGINNALIKISINIKVYMQVIIPFTSKEIIVSTDIPVVMKLVEGSVPSYYYPEISSKK